MFEGRYTIVDAFADEPFAGNPAAVLILDTTAGEVWMQQVAREFNLSETAFAHREHDAWRLRWFTPTIEVDACGHATLATAHVLLREQSADDPVVFATRSGPLTCWEDAGAIAMRWPTDPSDAPVDREAIEGAIGAPVHRAGAGREYVVAEVADAATVARLSPDLAAVARLPLGGLVVTARGDGARADVVSRMFAPQSGIPEDPVTGSAHCALAPWWADRVGWQFRAAQLSDRGGSIDVRLVDSEHVELRGNAVTIASGILTEQARTGGPHRSSWASRRWLR